MAQGRTLTVYLAADTDKFRRGIDDADRGLSGFRSRVSSFSSALPGMLGAAAVGAGVALGALATKMAVDGVQAAIAQEEATSKLKTALDSIGQMNALPGIETFISSLSRATNTADDELYPAMTKLVTATNSVDTAQRLLSVGLDIAAQTGKPLESVLTALAKAADGNVTPLQRLGLGIEDLKAKATDTPALIDALQQKFGGAAAAQAETYGGKIKGISIAFDELKESFGVGFLSGIDSAMSKSGDLTDTLYEQQQTVEQLGESVGGFLTDLLELIGYVTAANDAFTTWKENLNGPVKTALDAVIQSLTYMMNPLQVILDTFRALNSLFSGQGLGPAPAPITPTYTNPGASGYRPSGGSGTTVWNNVQQNLDRNNTRQGSASVRPL